MVAFHGRNNLQLIVISLVAILFLFGNVISQNCDFDTTILLPNVISRQYCECDPTLCCNRNTGYCGTTEPWCGWPDCLRGPCESPPPSNHFPVEDFVTDEFFDSLFNKSMQNCSGHSFYTRQAFLEAANNQDLFARIGNDTDSKLELAAFFAIALNPVLTHDFCYVKTQNETEQNEDYCDRDRSNLFPCFPGKKYYGRGPLQLKWNYNYGEAEGSKMCVPVDLLQFPDLVHEHPEVSFEASMWYWVNIVHKPFTNGFAYAVRAVYPGLCDGRDNPNHAIAIQYFQKFCNRFGVDPNLAQPLHC